MTEMRQLVDAAMDRIMALIDTLPQQAVDTSSNVDAEFVRSLIEPLPETPATIDELLDQVFDHAVHRSLNPISPGFMGYVPGGGLFHAAVADLIADGINRYVGAAAVAPALSRIEANVVQWLCDIVGYPESARGFLTSGGSLATLSAMITARHVVLGDDFSKGIIYYSDQRHHCIDKAALLAGFTRKQLKPLPTDESYRLDVTECRRAVGRDRDDGLRPFMIVGNAGSVNTGAVDPLAELGAFAGEESLWFHVDAAYGGLFCLTDRGKRILRGLDSADSIVVDPHKTLFLPYGTGALLVRDGRHLKATHSSTADYLPRLQDEEELWDFCEISPELTRPFRGLRVWLPIKLHGVGVFRDVLNEKLDLARWLHDRILEIEELEILAPPELSILAFAVKDTGRPVEERNERSRRLLSLVNRKNRVHLTGTMLDGVFAIRIAIVAYRTHLQHVEMLLEDLVEALGELRPI